MRIERQPLLTWFGVLGAPLAWTLQLWTASGLTIAACWNVRRDVPFDALAAGLTALAAVTAVLAGASAFAVLRQTRDAPEEPPGSRIHFLAVIGVTVSFLFGCLILMTGLGVVFTDTCHQS